MLIYFFENYGQHLYRGLVKVLWNGVYSQNFSVINDVKEGGILSPVLFVSILMNCCLLTTDKCGMFYGQLVRGCPGICRRYRVNGAYTATAVRRMLAVCDEFAVKLDVRFNASKSKCMFFRL